MRLTENAVAAEVLVHLAWQAQETLRERPDGVHVSDVVGCPRKAWYGRNGRPEHHSLDTKLMFMTGSGHHAMIQDIAKIPPDSATIEVEVPVRVVAPGVLIHGTVDLLLSDPVGGDELVAEIKTTRASSNKNPEESSHYLEQIASYCVALGVSKARLYILHLQGNYRDIRTPQLKCWELEFAPEELIAWEREMLRRHALIVGEATPHPYEARSWECGYCSHSEKNGGPCPGGGLRVPFFINRTIPAGIPLTLVE